MTTHPISTQAKWLLIQRNYWKLFNPSLFIHAPSIHILHLHTGCSKEIFNYMVANFFASKSWFNIIDFINGHKNMILISKFALYCTLQRVKKSKKKTLYFQLHSSSSSIIRQQVDGTFALHDFSSWKPLESVLLLLLLWRKMMNSKLH